MTFFKYKRPRQGIEGPDKNKVPGNKWCRDEAEHEGFMPARS